MPVVIGMQELHLLGEAPSFLMTANMGKRILLYQFLNQREFYARTHRQTRMYVLGGEI